MKRSAQADRVHQFLRPVVGARLAPRARPNVSHRLGDDLRRPSCADRATRTGSWKIICMCRRCSRSALVAEDCARSRRGRARGPPVGSVEPQDARGRASSCRSPIRRRARASRRADVERNAIDALTTASVAAAGPVDSVPPPRVEVHLEVARDAIRCAREAVRSVACCIVVYIPPDRPAQRPSA